MKIRITTGEQETNLAPGRGTWFVRCELELTTKEQSVLLENDLAEHILATNTDLATGSAGNHGNPLSVQEALVPGGLELTLGSIVEMRDKEEELLQNCRKLQVVLSKLSSYRTEKTYEIDLSAELVV